MLSTTFFGCIVFLTTNISLLYISHLFVRRFLPNAPPSVRLVAIGTLFYSFILLIFQALSPFHAITKTWVTVSCLLLALVFHLLWGKQRNLQADIEPIRSWVREGLASKWAILLIICGFVVLLSFSRAILMPPLTWDCLTYHLISAALWIKKGTLLLFKAPDIIECSSHYQINGQIFASWLLLPFHNDLLANIMNFPITLLGGISCYAIARELGLTRKEASWAPALICFSPVIYSQITTALVDNAIFVFCSAAVLFTLRYLHRGYLYDGLLAVVAAGILLGIKFSGIPAVGLIFIVTTIKTICLVRHSGFLKKSGLILLGILILCSLGGRLYILNTIEAGNPLYPITVNVFNKELFKGSHQIEQISEWLPKHERKRGWAKVSRWGIEYRKFFYTTFAAGPKFFPLLILAFISLFTKPHDVSKKVWYFLAVMWIVPIAIHYVDTPASVARRGPFVGPSNRFLSHSLALLTIQGLVFVKKFKYSKKIDFFLASLVVWDLMHVNKTHLREVEVLYPFLVSIILLTLIFLKPALVKLKSFTLKKEPLLISTSTRSSRVGGGIASMVIAYSFIFVILIGGLYFLQSYRDSTRYIYFREHEDLGDILRFPVNGWEFLDQPDKKKTIALTIGWKPPGGSWFFYPLLGRWLQNDIVYISAKHKREVPTYYDRGLLRGKDFLTWLHNLKKNKVDYIFVQKPWPIELKWIQDRKNMFELVFNDRKFKIFKYFKSSPSLSKRFNDNGDETVTDYKTGLMWTKNANLLGDTITFNEAFNYIEGMNEGKYPNFGYTDWRLPTLREVQSLIDYTQHTKKGHKLPRGHPFHNVQSLRLNDETSATYISNSEYPRFFSFYCRLVGHNIKSCYGYIWPVRSLPSYDRIDMSKEKQVYIK